MKSFSLKPPNDKRLLRPRGRAYSLSTLPASSNRALSHRDHPRGLRVPCAHGFTLLEVMVALTVLAVGAALTLSLISGTLGNIRKVQMRARTIEHAQSVMELALLDESIRQPTTFNGDFEDGTRWSVRVEEYALSGLQAQIPEQARRNMPVKLFQYTVEMTSPDAREPDYRLQTLKLVRVQSEEQALRLPQR